jgi:hypothetical protein
VTQPRESPALRRAVLAVTLLDRSTLAELDITDAGVTRCTGGGTPLTVPWGELLLAAGDPLDLGPEPVRRRRIARWLRLRIALHDLIDGPTVTDRVAAAAGVVARVRPRALPLDHVTHPGPSWPRRGVLGGALEVGLAIRGFDDDGRPDPDGVGLLPTGVLVAARVDITAAADRADRYLADMADLASRRIRLDPTSVLRPLGDADVLTLLASRSFRTAVVDGQGMRSAAVPVRTRGWLDLSRLDPAFAITAAELTEPDDRGFPRPVLITVDEVALVRAGGDAVRQSLSDPAPPEPARPATRSS